MICSEAQPTLALTPFDLRDGLVTPAERATLDAHVNACLPCQDEAAALEGFLAAWSRVTDEDREETPLSSALRERALAAQPESAGAPRIRRTGQRTPSTCAYCHGDVSQRALVYCQTCRAPHHAACFRQHGRCSTLSCGETEFERAAERPALAAPPTRRPSRWRVLVSAASLVLCVGAAALVEKRFAEAERHVTVRQGVVLATMEAQWLRRAGVLWAPPFGDDVQEHLADLAGLPEVATVALVTRPLNDPTREVLGVSGARGQRIQLTTLGPRALRHSPGEKTLAITEGALRGKKGRMLPVLRVDVELPEMAHDGGTVWLSIFLDRTQELERRAQARWKIRGFATLVFLLVLAGVYGADRLRRRS